MFQNETVFFVLSFLAAYRGFRILETSRDEITTPINFFFAILGGIGAYQFWHFYAPGLPQVALFGYVFLGVSPLLAYILGKFIFWVFQVVLFLITFALFCSTGFLLIPSLSLDGLVLGSIVLAAASRLPYGRVFKWHRDKRLRREREEKQHQEDEKLLQQEQEELRQKQEEQSLMEKLIRDLAK